MKHIIFLLAVVALSSCGRIKQMTQTDSSYSKDVVKSDSSEVIKTTEKVDTLVTLDPITYDVSTHLIELEDTTYVVLDTPEVKVISSVNSKTKVLRTKAVLKERKVAVKVDKSSEVKRQGKTTVRSIQKDDSKAKEKSKPSKEWMIWLAVILVLIAAYLAIRFMPYRIIRK